MSEDVVWCNLVRNQNKNADNQPDWVAPPNRKAPEGNFFTIKWLRRFYFGNV